MTVTFNAIILTVHCRYIIYIDTNYIITNDEAGKRSYTVAWFSHFICRVTMLTPSIL